MAERFYLLKDLYAFLKENKKWWIIPLLIFIVLLGLLIFFSTASPIPVFVYPLL